jgi:RNA polymerase sigma-70 factor (ECF subfamily)
LIVAARGGESTDSQRALADLCEAYWYPLYAFVRGQGYDADRAKDLTQGYFATLLEKDYLDQVDPEAGRFRTFLRVTMKHYLINEAEKERAMKRGGGVVPVSLDTEEAEQRYRFEPVDRLTPEQVYERRWALTLLGRVLERVGLEYEEEGSGARFDALKGYLTGEEPHFKYQEVAQSLEMSQPAVRAWVRRMRQRFGRLLRSEIAETVVDPQDIDDEVRHLLRMMGKQPSEPA